MAGWRVLCIWHGLGKRTCTQEALASKLKIGKLPRRLAPNQVPLFVANREARKMGLRPRRSPGRRRWGENTSGDEEAVISLLGCPTHRSRPEVPPIPCDDPTLVQLRLECSTAFEEEASDPMLRALWLASSLPSDEYSRISERWLRLGFQSDEPARDLRGAGCGTCDSSPTYPSSAVSLAPAPPA